MKLEELKFIGRALTGRYGHRHGNGIFPRVFVRKSKDSSSAVKPYRIRVAFHCCDNIILDNSYCVYSIINNRLYFKFLDNESECVGYKISKPKSCYSKLVMFRSTEALSKFVRDVEYKPKFDNECGLWYIEY